MAAGLLAGLSRSARRLGAELQQSHANRWDFHVRTEAQASVARAVQQWQELQHRLDTHGPASAARQDAVEAIRQAVAPGPAALGTSSTGGTLADGGQAGGWTWPGAVPTAQ
ncbi:hypothetical protein HaLaN_00157 [Haematococcus lacustris]|uniref:Uncharacterized protein n=1 Tax=Haematococcus lacustris TaxID=44745 RepID=A0A699YCT0_HAELA|nr:hypothetical protein HaLaN_00157 [Haematococcus lacustris]